MVKITRKLIGSDRTLYEIKTSKNGKSYGVYTNKQKSIKDAKKIIKEGKKVGVYPVKLVPSKKKSTTFNY